MIEFHGVFRAGTCAHACFYSFHSPIAPFTSSSTSSSSSWLLLSPFSSYSSYSSCLPSPLFSSSSPYSPSPSSSYMHSKITRYKRVHCVFRIRSSHTFVYFVHRTIYCHYCIVSYTIRYSCEDRMHNDNWIECKQIMRHKTMQCECSQQHRARKKEKKTRMRMETSNCNEYDRFAIEPTL